MWRMRVWRGEKEALEGLLGGRADLIAVITGTVDRDYESLATPPPTSIRIIDTGDGR